jgi:drug/metabolite transporter (DMT)-like permease
VLTVFYTLLALVAFAANSVLCRVALHTGAIDAATFLTIRMAAGAVTLAVVTRLSERRGPGAGSWTSAIVLLLYGVPFSFAYMDLAAGTGALILFGSVQIAMIASALWRGEKLGAPQWLGLALALAGLVYLTRPGLTAPPAAAAALMAIAGVMWGVYSLRGRTAAHPVDETLGNFVRVLPFVLAVSILVASQGHAHARASGVAFAALSGSLATGLGYVVWYRALRGLTRTQAAVVQLAVPVIAAAGGALLLSEMLTGRVLVAAAMILGGIAVTIAGR